MQLKREWNASWEGTSWAGSSQAVFPMTVLWGALSLVLTRAQGDHSVLTCKSWPPDIFYYYKISNNSHCIDVDLHQCTREGKQLVWDQLKTLTCKYRGVQHLSFVSGRKGHNVSRIRPSTLYLCRVADSWQNCSLLSLPSFWQEDTSEM